MTWRPIETLTREDGPVLGWRIDGGRYGVIVGVMFNHFNTNDGWLLDEWGAFSAKISHWMPLPDAPTT